MTDYRGIAGVSRTLRTLLRDRMEAVVDVTIAPPDVVITDVGGKRLNLYLFQISRNAELANQEIPGQGHRAAYGHPPLSLDLHYLFTAFGSGDTEADADLEAQEILGDAMSTLHDFAVITESLTVTRAAAGTIGDRILDPSLRGEFERVKITLQPLDLEDVSSLWTALPDANFRRSVGYEISVVQIEAQRPRRFPPPVGERPEGGPALLVVPMKRPRIDELRFRRPGDAADTQRRPVHARVGDAMIIRGSDLRGDHTRVLLGDVDVTASVTTHRSDRIELAIPDDAGLQPGPVPVVVVHDVLVGDPPAPRTTFKSNAAVCMLVPRIDSLTPDLGANPRTLRIDGARLFDADRECLALVGEIVLHSDEYTTATPARIVFELPADLGSGDYAVRVRVGGAENIDRHVLTIPS